MLKWRVFEHHYHSLHKMICLKQSQSFWISAFFLMVLPVFNAFSETHRWSSSRSGARLPASSCVARKPARHYVSGLRAHWPGAGEKWHHAGSRTRWPDRSPLPSQSPSIYAVPERYDRENICYESAENKWKLVQRWPRACTFFFICATEKNMKDHTMNHPLISEPLVHSVKGFHSFGSNVNLIDDWKCFWCFFPEIDFMYMLREKS